MAVSLFRNSHSFMNKGYFLCDISNSNFLKCFTTASETKCVGIPNAGQNSY